jgi:hypothetical protein
VKHSALAVPFVCLVHLLVAQAFPRTNGCVYLLTQRSNDVQPG